MWPVFAGQMLRFAQHGKPSDCVSEENYSLPVWGMIGSQQILAASRIVLCRLARQALVCLCCPDSSSKETEKLFAGIGGRVL